MNLLEREWEDQKFSQKDSPMFLGSADIWSQKGKIFSRHAPFEAWLSGDDFPLFQNHPATSETAVGGWGTGSFGFFPNQFAYKEHPLRVEGD